MGLGGDTYKERLLSSWTSYIFLILLLASETR